MNGSRALRPLGSTTVVSRNTDQQVGNFLFVGGGGVFLVVSTSFVALDLEAAQLTSTLS